MDQSRILAKQLTKSLYCDSILHQIEKEVELLKQMNAVSDSSIFVLQLKSDTQKLLLLDQDNLIEDLTQKLTQVKKDFRKEKWKKRICAMGAFLITLLAVEQNITANH